MRRGIALALILLSRNAAAQPVDHGSSANAMPGAFRIVSATPGRSGSTTISAGTEFFSKPGFIFPGHNHRRSAYSLAASWNAARWLSIGATVLAATNHDSATDPVFIYAMGDVELGARLGVDLVRRDAFAISAGARGGVRLMQGAAPGAKVGDSASPSARALLTIEASRARLSLDAGYLSDRSRFLLDDDQAIDAGQAYAWGISDYDAIVGGLGLELALGRVTPIVEVSGRHDLEAPGDPAVIATAGLRIRASERLSLYGAGDFGISGTELVPGRLRAPDWNVAAGLALALGERTRARTVPRVPIISENLGRLRGRVIDVETTTPIAGVEIVFEGKLLTTDAEGRFDLGEVRTGTIRLEARHPKYAPVTAPAYVTEKQVTSVRLELRPAPSSPIAGSIVGTVFDSRGVAIGGARVAVVASGEERAVIAGADGRFRLESPAGSFALTASAEGHDSRTEMSSVAAGGSVEVIVRLLPKSGVMPPAVMPGTGKLGGRVTGAKGVIANAKVTAIGADGSTRSAKTNAKGRFSLELPAGDWQVAVAAIGYPTQTQRCRVDAKKPLSLEFVLIKPTKPRAPKKKQK